MPCPALFSSSSPIRTRIQRSTHPTLPHSHTSRKPGGCLQARFVLPCCRSGLLQILDANHARPSCRRQSRVIVLKVQLYINGTYTSEKLSGGGGERGQERTMALVEGRRRGSLPRMNVLGRSPGCNGPVTNLGPYYIY